MGTKYKIYIQLLDEGTVVYRPTTGEQITDCIFKVLPTQNYDPEDEHWEFTPGKIVRCRIEIKAGEEIRVAYEEVEYESD